MDGGGLVRLRGREVMRRGLGGEGHGNYEGETRG